MTVDADGVATVLALPGKNLMEEKGGAEEKEGAKELYEKGRG